MQHFVDKISINEYRIFIVMNPQDGSFATLEFDRYSLMIVGHHHGFSRVESSPDSLKVMLQDEDRLALKVLQIVPGLNKSRVEIDLENRENDEFQDDSEFQQMVEPGKYDKDGVLVEKKYIQRKYQFVKGILTSFTILSESTQPSYMELVHLKPSTPKQIKYLVLKIGIPIEKKEKSLAASYIKVVIVHTPNFRVIKIYNKIIFHNLDDIQPDQGKKENFQEIQLKDFASEIYKQASRGMTISAVQKSSLKYFQTDDRSEDLIQITFPNIVIIWNLQKNQEVTTVENQEFLQDAKTFVNTGYQVSLTQQRKDADRNIYHLFKKQCNDSGLTAFTQPYIINKGSREVIGSYFKPYTMRGLIEVDFYKLNPANFKINKTKKASIDAILSEVGGETIFFALQDQSVGGSVSRILDQAVDEIEAVEEDEQKVLLARQIAGLITLPVPYDCLVAEGQVRKFRDDYRKNFIQHNMSKLDDQTQNDTEVVELDEYFDQCIQILTEAQNCRIYQLCSTVDEFWQFYRFTYIDNPEWREESIIKEKMKIWWRKDSKIVVFGAPTTLYSQKKIKLMIKEQQEIDRKSEMSYFFKKILCCRCKESNSSEIDLDHYKMAEVLVRRYKLNWIGDEKQLMKLIMYLTDESFDQLFDDLLISDIIKMQSHISKRIAIVCLVPYMLKVVLMLSYLIYFSGIPNEVMTNSEKIWSVGLWVAIFIPVGWLQITEFNQLREAGFFNYMADKWNKLILLETMGIITVFVFWIRDYQGIALPVIASLTAFNLVNNLFYWARISLKTASQAFITWRSIAGSLTFMGLCLVLLVAFAGAFLVLNNIQKRMTQVFNPAIWDYTTPYVDFTSSNLGIPFIDTIYESYFSGLGQFPFLGSDVVPMYKPIVQYEIWILLFFSTLFVSLLFINTLVSVIGAEYSNLWENKDRYGLMETTQLYADHMDTCPPKIPSGTCVYIVSQTTETTFEDKVEDFQAQTQIQIGELQETVDKIENKMNQILEKLDEQD